MENVIFYKFRKSNNNWIIAFLNNETNNYTIIKNDINSLKEFLDNQKNSVFIGANNSIYDDIFITSLLKNGNLYDEVKKEDIEETLPISFDVTEGIVRNNIIDFNNMVSCLWDKDNKPLLYNYSYKEEDIETQLKKDLLIIQSFYQDNERNNYINWKKEVIEEFNLPKSAYRESYGYIMKQIVGLEINESSPNSNNITLDSRLDKALKGKNDPFLNQLLNILMYYYNNINTLEKQKIKLDNCLIKFNLQGITGSMDSDYIDTNIKDDIKYLYIDFNSFGPNILINNKWLDEVAKNPSNYELVKNRRIDLKGKKDIKQLYYKYLLNSGLDYLNKVKTKNGENIGLSLTITGIMTMMLLYSNIKPYGIELIECNTDGFIVKCPSKYIDKVKLEVKKIEKDLSLSCDVDIVDKIAHFNTQNYVMQYENGSEKHLGYFGNAQTHPLYCSGITAVETALKEYYLNGIPVSVTLRKLRNENELKAFQIIKKPKINEKRRYINDGGLYYPYDRTSYRLFAVREDALKTPLYTKNKKEKYEIDKKKRGRSVKDGFYYFELSDNHIPNIYDIDLNYYIDECYKIINAHPINKEIQIMKPKQKKFCFVDIDGTLIKNKDEITTYTIFSNAAKELVKDEEISIAYNLFNKQKGCYLLQFLSLCKTPRKPGSIEDYFAEFLESKNLFPGKTTAEYKLFVKRFLENDKEFSTLLSTYTYAKELLVYLKNEGVYNCINSNWFKSVQTTKLESTGLDEYIDDICTIDDHQAKPSLAGWKELLNNHNVSSDDFVISLGDTTSDIAPKSLNIPSIIIDHNERKLSQRVLSNGIIINDFSEIMNPNFYSEIDKIKKYRRN